MNNKVFNYEKSYVLCNDNIEEMNKIIYLPIYMVMFIEKLKSNEKKIVHLDISKLI